VCVAETMKLSDAIRVVIRMARIAQQVCEEVGLTLPQYRALNSAARGRRRAFELARYSSVSRPAMSALTAGLERMGLFERSTAESDGRGVYFVASDRGLQALDEVERLLVQRFEEVLGPAVERLGELDIAAIEAALDQQVERDFGPSDEE
jgi:DNA-binding MarR family transcriptional regulator